VCVRVTPFEELQSYYRTDIGVWFGERMWLSFKWKLRKKISCFVLKHNINIYLKSEYAHKVLTIEKQYRNTHPRSKRVSKLCSKYWRCLILWGQYVRPLGFSSPQLTVRRPLLRSVQVGSIFTTRCLWSLVS
jgi:hypothetical protein